MLRELLRDPQAYGYRKVNNNPGVFHPLVNTTAFQIDLVGARDEDHDSKRLPQALRHVITTGKDLPYPEVNAFGKDSNFHAY